MTQNELRISDPTALMLRLDEALESVGSLDELIEELVGAKDRLAQAEARALDAAAGAERVSESASSTLASAATRMEEWSTTVRSQIHQLAEDRAKHEISLNTLASETISAIARFREDTEAHVTQTLVEVHDAASTARTASDQVRRENEEFRREQLTKLDDLQSSHRILSDRQRENETRFDRKSDALTTELSQSKLQTEKILAELRGSSEAALRAADQARQDASWLARQLADETRKSRRLSTVAITIAAAALLLAGSLSVLSFL